MVLPSALLLLFQMLRSMSVLLVMVGLLNLARMLVVVGILLLLLLLLLLLKVLRLVMRTGMLLLLKPLRHGLVVIRRTLPARSVDIRVRRFIAAPVAAPVPSSSNSSLKGFQALKHSTLLRVRRGSVRGSVRCASRKAVHATVAVPYISLR